MKLLLKASKASRDKSEKDETEIKHTRKVSNNELTWIKMSVVNNQKIRNGTNSVMKGKIKQEGFSLGEFKTIVNENEITWEYGSIFVMDLQINMRRRVESSDLKQWIQHLKIL